MKKFNKIKDMPKDLRPYEKCEMYGPAYLGDAELLSIIIKTGYKGFSAVELADELLGLSPEKNLSQIGKFDLKDIITLKGFGRVKAIQIICLFELAGRIKKSSFNIQCIFNNPQLVADYYMEEYRYKDKEELLLIMLNSKSALIAKSVISIGTVNSSYASPREIYIEAIKNKAVSIILLHNHPSGDPTPSRNDISSTRRIKEAGELIGIELLDHIIIGNNKYISFNEKELL